jgi:hypothetical protein
MSVRGEVLLLMVMIAVVDGAAIAVYHFAGFAGSTGTKRLIFTGAWMAASLAVVLAGLWRVRMARERKRY